jgi:hypothetical protein
MGVNQAGAASALPEEGDNAPRAAEKLSGTESPATRVAGVSEGMQDGIRSVTKGVRVPLVITATRGDQNPLSRWIRQAIVSPKTGP